MKFNEYDVVKTQYTITEQYKELSLYLCADKECTDHAWQAPLSSQTEIKASDNFYRHVPRKIPCFSMVI